MTPYLHFVGGDYLLFKSLRPVSHGAIAGACIVLVLLSIFERLLAAGRGIMEDHWKQRILAMTSHRFARPTSDAGLDSDGSSEGKEKVAAGIEQVLLKSASGRPDLRRARLIAPFIPSHDLTRGALYALQALLSYALMLAVMTFQAAYIIAIIVGLGIGEILFGRFGGQSVH